MNKQEDQAFEQLLTQAVQNVGTHRDRALIKSLGYMTHEQLELMLRPQQRRGSTLMTLARLAAACAVVAVIIVAVGRLNFGGNTQYENASLFNSYYKEYNVSNATFDAASDRINTLGGKSTAAYIEEASILISKKHSKHDLRRGIALLEQLLTYGYKPELAHEIHWYLGLGYLKDNRTDKVKSEMLTVIELEKTQAINVHSKDAKKIIKQIEH